MINIDETKLIETLKESYEKVKYYQSKDNKNAMLKMIGWCNAIENIIFKFSPENKEEILKIRRSIISDDKSTVDINDLDVPTFIRTK